jgi:hypothetical protein
VILLVIFFFVWGLFKREKVEAKVWVWGTVGSYFIFFLFLFGFNSDVRYLFPIIPLFCLIASKAIASVRQKWISILIFFVCLAQFGGTLVYVHGQRRIPEELREGFSYIRTHIPKDALLIYPEYILSEVTGRRFVWSSFFEIDQHMIKRKYRKYPSDWSRMFFWNSNTEDMMRSLRINKVDYIVVKKSRIYDDSKVKHLGGYPKSFVQRMPGLPFLKLVLENNGMSIWEVRKECLSPL